jgi:hypothetical protein
MTAEKFRIAADGDVGAPLMVELPAAARSSGLWLNLPEDMAMQDWAQLGSRLCRAEHVMKWWIGDWAAFGVKKYGKLKEFADTNGFDYGTLRNLAYVSASVELSRRRDNVEWSKHAEVAPLPAKEQEKWLSRTEKEELPVAELRRRIRQDRGTKNALESDGPVLRFAFKACDDLVNWLKTRPEEFWDEERRAAWRKRLEPVVKFWEKL